MASHRFILRALRGIALAAALVQSGLASAQVMIRDAEIERSLSELAAPIIQAAGLSPSRIQITVLKDDSLNAFVVDASHIFVNSGLILRLKTVQEVQAVLAHEIAHIANGHLTRRPANARAAQKAAIASFALGGLAAVTGNTEAGVGLAAGGINSAQRKFFAHTRAEEASADQSALRYMATAGVDPQAMRDVLEVFRGQEVLNIARQDPYAVTHPLKRDRIRAVEGYVATYKDRAREPSDNTKYWYARLNAKLGSFLRNPSYTLRRVKKNDTSEIALLTKAIAYHQMPDPKQAIANVNALIAKRPKDPYYNELKGQILLESRQFKAAEQAYRKAAALAPRQPLILAGLGQTLLAQDSAAKTREALKVLKSAYARDRRNPRLLRDLAVAYAKTDQPGLASVTTAERYAVLGRLKDAGIHANRALGLLPRGSAGWKRAQDIADAARQAE